VGNIILLALLRVVYVVILVGTFMVTIVLVLTAGNRIGMKYLHEVSGDIIKGFSRQQ
jgi:hypothetical protein